MEKLRSGLEALSRQSLRSLANTLGYRVQRLPGATGRAGFAPDFTDDDIATYRAVQGYTLTSLERVTALCDAVRYIVRASIPGDIVECGVWRGGSMMAVAMTLIQQQVVDRRLRLFDTFQGMTRPTEADVLTTGESAAEILARAPESDVIWARAPLNGVRAALGSTGYSAACIDYVVGPVEETLPAQAPAQISLLRLDTDWYESTLHEWVHLYPRLAIGGVVIVDDYGHWAGARQATDTYLREHGVAMLLSRIDETGRIGIKTAHSL